MATKKRKAAKPSPYTFDRKTGRWRKNGKFSKPPKPSQLRKNKKGQPVDSTGRAVPKSAFPAPPRPKRSPAKASKSTKQKPKKSAPKKAPKVKKPRGGKRKAAEVKKPKEPKYRLGPVPIARPRTEKTQIRGYPPRKPVYVPDGFQISTHQILSSRFENRREPATMAEVLQNHISRKAEQVKIPTPDLVFYQYGLELVCTSIPRSAEQTQAFVKALAKEYPDYTFTWNEASIHVTAGSRERPSSLEQITKDMKRRTDTFLDIYQYAADFWDQDIGWFVFAENDDLETGS